MRARNVLLVGLVLVNLLLVTALVLNVTTPRSAEAQVLGGGNNYAVVTAELVQGDEDALWILDLRTRKIYAFRLPQGQAKEMVEIGWRDVGKDLRPKEKGRN